MPYIQKGFRQVSLYLDGAKALDDVASGSMSIVSIIKTRRCSGHGEKVSDTIAKGDIASLATM